MAVIPRGYLQENESQHDTDAVAQPEEHATLRISRPSNTSRKRALLSHRTRPAACATCRRPPHCQSRSGNLDIQTVRRHHGLDPPCSWTLDLPWLYWLHSALGRRPLPAQCAGGRLFVRCGRRVHDCSVWGGDDFVDASCWPWAFGVVVV